VVLLGGGVGVVLYRSDQPDRRPRLLPDLTTKN